MGSAQFNAFDILLVVVLVSSGIFAFRRGLIREIMALGTWVLASVFAFAFYPIASPLFHQHIKNAMLADAATGIGLFCVAIIVLVPLGDFLAALVKSPTLSSIDRSLGFVFGILRGFVIMCLLYLATTFIWPEGQGVQPVWLEEAKTKPALSYGVEMIKSLVPENAEEEAAKRLKESQEEAEKAFEDAKRLEDISTPIPVYKGKGSAPVYDDTLRDTMDTLTDGKDEQ